MTANARIEYIAGDPALCADVAGSGPLLLFLHGVGGSRGNWATQLAHFGDRFTAVALDLRGYGDSADYAGPLAFTAFADDAVRVIDHFGVDRAHVCGLSMGGRIALDLWRRHRDRVATLMLADTSAASREAQDPARIEAFLAMRRQPLLDGITPAELAPKLVETLAGPNIGAEALAELTRSLATLHAESYLKTLEAVTRFTDFPDFADIDVPTLVIAGSEDKIAPPPIAEAMAAAIPGANLAILPGAGHVSNVEMPEAFNAVLDMFLKEAA